MREIVLDTETTGLEPGEGHRVVEIGALELSNHLPTGRVFHAYINPERHMPADAQLVHGLTAAFLARASRCSPRWSTTSSPSSTTTRTTSRRRPGSSSTTRCSTSPSSTASSRASACRRSTATRGVIDTMQLGQAALSGRSQQPRRALPALRRRRLGAHPARRAARRRAARRGLSRPDRRPPAGPRPGGRARRADHAAGARARAAGPAGPMRRASRSSPPMPRCSSASRSRSGWPERPETAAVRPPTAQSDHPPTRARPSRSPAASIGRRLRGRPTNVGFTRALARAHSCVPTLPAIGPGGSSKQEAAR